MNDDTVCEETRVNEVEQKDRVRHTSVNFRLRGFHEVDEADADLT